MIELKISEKIKHILIAFLLLTCAFSTSVFAASNNVDLQKDSSETKADSKQDAKSDSSDKNDAVAKDDLLNGEQAVRSFSGNVSWYGMPFHGRKTASGEIFDMYKLSAAHLTLPLPTRVLVEDPRSGNVVIVRVNDRGPYVKTRVMDLSREAARLLGYLSRGVAFVDVTVLKNKKTKPKNGA